MKNVWVVESGDYEARGIDGIYSSVESAVSHIKTRYGHPYVVAWELDELTLIGHFEVVLNYSSQHTSCFDIKKWEVDCEE